MNFKKIKSIAIIAFVSVFLTNCSSETNDDIAPDPGAQIDGEISVFDIGEDTRDISINGSDVSGSTALVKVAFRDADNTMKRLYITQNISGLGDTPFSFSAAGVTVDDKKDGSLDLSADNAGDFEFAIPFPLPSATDSKIVYTLWATTGRGDFRDITKRNAIVVDGVSAVGTVTIVGDVAYDPSGISSYSVRLYAPLIDESSQTFFSTFDGKVYEIAASDEFLDIWDFGYYYIGGEEGGPSGPFDSGDFATLASISNYDIGGTYSVSNLTDVSPDEFNRCYFRKDSSLDFDAVTTSGDLTFSTPTNQKANRLLVDEVIEFENQYGKKGLIKVIDINFGFGSDDYIDLDIKVQN